MWRRERADIRAAGIIGWCRCLAWVSPGPLSCASFPVAGFFFCLPALGSLCVGSFSYCFVEYSCVGRRRIVAVPGNLFVNSSHNSSQDRLNDL